MPDPGADRLRALAEDVQNGLRALGEPAAAWADEPGDADAEALVVGAGQCGIAAAFALKRIGVRRLRVVSRDAPEAAGPWRSFARMPTLRSPKHAPGPELGLPALTYERWHKARYGAAEYAALDLIRTEDWAAYLDWFRETVGIAVEHGRALTNLSGSGSRVTADFADGGTIVARQVVLATGMDALGRPATPPPFQDLPPERVLDCYGAIDFQRLQGKRLAVIGAASTAFDNAAAALEAGAAAVDLYCRRPRLNAINHMKGVAAYGAVAHWADFDDAARWRFALLGASRAAPPTGPTVARATRFPNFRILLNARIDGATATEDGVSIKAAGDARAYDAVLTAAGYALAPDARPELAPVLAEAARWRDRYQPPPDLENTDLAEFPYLDDGFAFTERRPGAAPWLGRVRLFAGPAVVSLGRVTGESGNLRYGVPRLAGAVSRALALEDAGKLYEKSAAYAVEETTFADYSHRATDLRAAAAASPVADRDL